MTTTYGMRALADQLSARVFQSAAEIRAEHGLADGLAMPCSTAYESSYRHWERVCGDVYLMCRPLFDAREVCHTTGLLTVDLLFRSTLCRLLSMHGYADDTELWMSDLILHLLSGTDVFLHRNGDCFEAPAPAESPPDTP